MVEVNLDWYFSPIPTLGNMGTHRRLLDFEREREVLCRIC